MGERITIQGCFIAFMIEAIRFDDLDTALTLTSDEVCSLYTEETKEIILNLFLAYLEL